MVRRPIALLGGALLGFAACSASPQATTPLPGPGASGLATPLPPAYTLRTDGAQGFSLGVPDAWDYVVRDSATFEADLRTVAQHSPELAAYFRQSFTSDAQVRLLAADSRSVATGFTANVQVMASDLGPAASAPSLTELADAKVRRLTQETTVTHPVKRTADHLSGLPAVRIEYTLAGAANNPVIRSYLVVVVRGGRRYEYELTMGALGEAAGTTFENLGRLFTLFTPTTASATTRPAAPSPGGGNPRGASPNQQ